MAVQGEIRRPNTAPKLTMTKTMARLCSHTLGRRNQAAPMPTEITMVAGSGSQKIVMMKIPQVNKKAKITLSNVLRAEIGTRKRAMPSTTITAAK